MPATTKPPIPLKICGAKKRDGSSCQATVVGTSGRCRMHGGAGSGAPKGNANAFKTGIYAAAMSEEDRAFGELTEVGKLDNEIAVVRIQLNRTIKAQKVYDEAIAAGEDVTRQLVVTRLSESRLSIEESSDESGGEKGGRSTSKSRTTETSDRVLERPDFEGLIDRWTSRLEKLEKTHAQLTGQMPDPDDEGGGAVATVRVRVIGGLPE